MKKNVVKMSLLTAMLLTAGTYASTIQTNANLPATPTEGTQFGFGGLNMDNITVNLSNGEVFDTTTGTYPFNSMARDDTFQSSVFNTTDDKSDESTRMGYVTQKPWPLSEPMGLKVINNDTEVSANGKPQNCIMASSYLATDDLDNGATPVICSSPAGSNKRFSLILLDNVIEGIADGAWSTKYVDLVFNFENPNDTDSNITRYQVFQKISNFTERRLDGLRIEVLDGNGNPDPRLTLSLGEGEEVDKDGLPTGGDLFAPYEMAFYPPGLWGDGSKAHLPEGWFDLEPSGYETSVSGDTIETGAHLSGNYFDLFGNWIPDKWVVYGVHEIDETDPNAEAELVAYWGTAPNEDFATDAPDWHFGQADNFATPSDAQVAIWAANPEKYPISDVEDLPNLSLNYIVNVGEANATGTDTFIIRFTPKVSVNQDAPSYVEYDTNGDRILPTLPEVEEPVNPIEPIPENPIEPVPSSGGGGCTYNPNSNSFDMMFLMMIALGSLYGFRRRFIK